MARKRLSEMTQALENNTGNIPDNPESLQEKERIADIANKWKFSDTLTDFDGNSVSFPLDDFWDIDAELIYRTISWESPRPKIYWHTWRRKSKIKPAKIQLPQSMKRKMKLKQKGWKK